MDADLAALPDDLDALKAALSIERARVREVLAERDAGAAELTVARAKASEDLALIAHQKLRIAKLERQIYGPRSERTERLIDQLARSFFVGIVGNPGFAASGHPFSLGINMLPLYDNGAVIPLAPSSNQ